MENGLFDSALDLCLEVCNCACNRGTRRGYVVNLDASCQTCSLNWVCFGSHFVREWTRTKMFSIFTALRTQ